MPGLVGLVTNLPRERASAAVLRMVSVLRHEPFYNTRVWMDERLGVYVGCCERAGSETGDMPQRNERGDVLFVSGEDFADPATARVPLAARVEQEPDFPASLNGRFHGLLVNHRDSQVVLFNDRYGLHRVYWHEGHDG